jgi:hypothetical protein
MNDYNRYFDKGSNELDFSLSRFDLGFASVILAFFALTLGSSVAGAASLSDLTIRAILTAGTAAGAVVLLRSVLQWGKPVRPEGYQVREPLQFPQEARRDRTSKAA